jgi:hypothetical protein
LNSFCRTAVGITIAIGGRCLVASLQTAARPAKPWPPQGASPRATLAYLEKSIEFLASQSRAANPIWGFQPSGRVSARGMTTAKASRNGFRCGEPRGRQPVCEAERKGRIEAADDTSSRAPLKAQRAVVAARINSMAEDRGPFAADVASATTKEARNLCLAGDPANPGLNYALSESCCNRNGSRQRLIWSY